MILLLKHYVNYNLLHHRKLNPFRKHPHFDEEMGTVETEVEAHQKKEISRDLLKGGTELKIHLKSTREAGGFGPQIPETDVEVTVDGNIVIVVYRVGVYGNPRAWEYQVITQ